jgi:hypothetical protein
MWWNMALYLGYKVAAFEAEGHRPRDESVYVMYTEVGPQVRRFAMRGDRNVVSVYICGPKIEEESD